MKKAFDQTVRDLKREVNKKVLKVPGIEQKILDATSNEPWGPHGSHLAEIAQATRNYHEYQMIMTVIWKRINDTGKNWRHVYKGLSVLEYLVANGSERVIDEIREHAYQISTLSDFQYIDSSGRDQGSNVRKKSQSLVALVNDKERVQEARQKAFANKDKYRSTFSTGGMHRPSSYTSTRGGYGDRYDDDRYGNRDEDRNGYGRDRDWSSRDDDRYGRGGDSYSRDGDRYGKDSDERYGRDSYRDDDYKGSQGHDYQFGSKNRSIDRDRDRSFEDDDRYSSRSGGGRADEPSHDERRLERKFSEPNVGAPPSYEEAISDAGNHIQDERGGGTIPEPAPKAPSPPAPKVSSPSKSISQIQSSVVTGAAVSPTNKEVDAFDEFDPRGSASAAAPAGSYAGVDFFGSLSDVDSINALALMPVTSTSTTFETDMPSNTNFRTSFEALTSVSTALSQPSEDPFGDSPFKAIPQDNNVPAQPQNFAPVTSFQTPTDSFSNSEPLPPVASKMETVSTFAFGDSFNGITHEPDNVSNVQLTNATSEFLPPVLPAAQPNTGVLGNLLPQTGYAATMSPQVFQPTTPESAPPVFSQSGLSGPLASQAHPSSLIFSQPGLSAPLVSQAAHPNLLSQPGLSTPLASQAATHPNLLYQSGLSAPLASQAALPPTTGPPAKAPQSKDKFETKSTVWTDTLSRGLVNLNISGPKINPLADIGIDFDSINRMEKRKEKEKSSANPVSTVSMGKAMGSGSGIGRAGATGLAPPPNPMMGSSMGMGNGGALGMGMGMGGYGGALNQPMGMGMGMNMGMNMGMGMGIGMGTGQGAPIRPPTGMPQGPAMPGVGYNPMMGMGGYGSQQQYGGGYR